MTARLLDLIAKKRDGGRLDPDEIGAVVCAAASGSAPDYQLSAWLMAVCCRGMAETETVALTRAMAASGLRLGLRGLARPKVDKHSTGGVGDGVSLALAPLVAAAGVVVPMMSGRGLGHTGGTLDKLESIPGFRVTLSPEEIRSQLAELGVAMFGQSAELAPADRKLYALRDATATVPSLPLIVGSILSKKLAEDLDALVLDVKVGSGAIFADADSAAELARALVRTAKGLRLRCAAWLTAMDQPLGRAVGNALEVRQAVAVLRGDRSASDYVEVLLTLGGEMLRQAGRARSHDAGARLLEKRLRNGDGFELLRKMVAAQGGDVSVLDDPARLPTAPLVREITAPREGTITRLDARKIGAAAVRLGAGRSRAEEKIDFGAGFWLEKKVGAAVRRGEVIARAYASDPARLEEGVALWRDALEIGARAAKAPAVLRRIG